MVYILSLMPLRYGPWINVPCSYLFGNRYLNGSYLLVETIDRGVDMRLVVREEGRVKTRPPITLTSYPSTSYPRALFSTVWPLSSHEVDGVRKEKERLTDDCRVVGKGWSGGGVY